MWNPGLEEGRAADGGYDRVTRFGRIARFGNSHKSRKRHKRHKRHKKVKRVVVLFVPFVAKKLVLRDLGECVHWADGAQRFFQRDGAEMETDAGKGSKAAQVFDDRKFAGGDQPRLRRAFADGKIHAYQPHAGTEHAKNHVFA